MKKLYLISIIIIISGIFYFKFSLEKDKTKTINIYSARKEKFLHEIIELFTLTTGIKVNIIVDKAPKLLAKLENEKNHTPADLFLTSDIISIETAKSKQLLKPIKDKSITALVNKKYKDDKDYWIGISKRSRLIFYNNKLQTNDKIRNYSDLAKPEFHKSILIRSSSNPYNQALIASLIHHKGENEATHILKNIVNNFARPPQGGDTDQLKALAKGIGKIAIANDYYYYRMKNSSDPIIKNYAKNISIVYPNQGNSGYNVNLSAIALTKYGKNVKESEKFIQFLLSPQIQHFLIEKNFEESVNIQININTHKEDIKTVKKFIEHSNTAIEIADKIGWQ